MLFMNKLTNLFPTVLHVFFYSLYDITLRVTSYMN